LDEPLDGHTEFSVGTVSPNTKQPHFCSRGTIRLALSTNNTHLTRQNACLVSTPNEILISLYVQECGIAGADRHDPDNGSFGVEICVRRLNTVQGLVPTLTLFSPFIYAFACFSVAVFFCLFHRAQS